MLTLTVGKPGERRGPSHKDKMMYDETSTSRRSLSRLLEALMTACFLLQPVNMQRRSDAVMTSAKSEHLVRQPLHSKEMKDLLKEIVNDSKDKQGKSNSPTSLSFSHRGALRLSPAVIGIKTHTSLLCPPITLYTMYQHSSFIHSPSLPACSSSSLEPLPAVTG